MSMQSISWGTPPKSPPSPEKSDRAIVDPVHNKFSSQLAISKERYRREILMLKRRHLHNLAYQRKRLLARYNIDETDPAIIDEDVRATIVYDLKAQIKGFQMALREKDIMHSEELRAVEKNLKRQMHTETEATVQRCESIISKYRTVAENLTLRVATLEAELKIQKQRNKDNVEELSKHLQEDGAEELKQMFIDSTAPERLDSIVTSITNMSSPIIAAHAASRKRPTRKAPSLSPSLEEKAAKNTQERDKQSVKRDKQNDKRDKQSDKRDKQSDKTDKQSDKKTVETKQEVTEQRKDKTKDSLVDDMEKYLTRKIWKVYDPYTSGFISAAKFKFMLEDFTHHTISTVDSQNILNSLDQNSDGMIGKEELSVFIHDGILMNRDEREEYANKSSLHKVIVEFFEGFEYECQAHASHSKEELELHNIIAAKAAERGARHEKKLQQQTDNEKRAKGLHDAVSQAAAEQGAKHEQWLSQKLDEERKAYLKEERKAKQMHDAIAKKAAEQGAQHESELLKKIEEEKNAKQLHDAMARMAAERGAQHEKTVFEKMEQERKAKQMHDAMARMAAEQGAQHESELLKKIEEEKNARQLHDAMTRMAAERGAQHEKTVFEKMEQERKAKQMHDAMARMAAEQGAQHESELLKKIEEEKNAKQLHDAMARMAAERGAQHEKTVFEKMEQERKAKQMHDAMARMAAEQGAQHESELLKKIEEEKNARQLHDAMTRMAAERGAQHEKTVFEKMEQERKAKQMHDAIAKQAAEQAAQHRVKARLQQVEAAPKFEPPQLQGSANNDKRKELKVGDRVRVMHADWFGRYSGIVTSKPSGAYTVTFDDGDVKESLPPETVFPGEDFTKGSTVLVQLEEWDEPFEGKILKLIEDNGENFYNVYFPADQTVEEVPEIAILNTVV